jgi:hypothetical protein
MGESGRPGICDSAGTSGLAVKSPVTTIPPVQLHCVNRRAFWSVRLAPEHHQGPLRPQT